MLLAYRASAEQHGAIKFKRAMLISISGGSFPMMLTGSKLQQQNNCTAQ